jgi:predicted ester cyclase
MSAENIAVARRWFQEVWNEKSENALFELMHPEARAHTARGLIVGAQAWKTQFWEVFQGAFSEIRVTVEDVAAVDDKVIVRWHARMKHTGGALGVPPTQEAVEFTGMSWVVVRGGRLVEGWDAWDATAVLRKCGVS